MPRKTIHTKTPIYENPTINARLDKRVYLKMDCYQPVGSFKARGVGNLCRAAVADGQTHLICSSGGNAGYAAAYAGRVLGVRVTVVVPETTGQLARDRISGEGAEVIERGSVWDEADAYARQLVEETGGAYIHPFDDPLVWAGHATLIEESVEQCDKPDVVVVAVGGAGLLCGVIEGMEAVGWGDVPVIAVETEGAGSLAHAIAPDDFPPIPKITSIATTLGALEVTPKALEWAARRQIIPVTVTDGAAVRACLSFADDLRVVTEPACGAALSLMYENSRHLDGYDSVLMVVCGGAGVTIGKLHEWAEKFK